jgi:hypothetical protein
MRANNQPGKTSSVFPMPAIRYPTGPYVVVTTVHQRRQNARQTITFLRQRNHADSIAGAIFSTAKATLLEWVPFLMMKE